MSLLVENKCAGTPESGCQSNNIVEVVSTTSNHSGSEPTVTTVHNEENSCHPVLELEDQHKQEPEVPSDVVSSDCISDESAVKTRKLPKPPDGGYGWFIVLGSFIMHLIIGGFERSGGVFFLQFQARFQQSAQLTAWPGAISGSLRLFVGPLATAVSNRYSIRTCCMIGSVLQFMGFFMNGFAPNLFSLFLSHSILVGVGCGFLYTPCLVILNMYFDKRRSLGAGLATSGVGMGSFLIVPLSQLLFDSYGFTGAFLIVSALAFNSTVVAMLYRPLSLHYKFINSETEERRTDVMQKTPLTSNSRENDADSPSSSYDVPATLDTRRDSMTEKPIINSVRKGPNSAIFLIDKCKNCVTSVCQICFPKEDSAFVKKSDKKVFHFYLLKEPSFLFFCTSIMFFISGLKSAFTFLPALVKSKGYTDTEAAFVISVAGVSDIISRIGSGVVFNLSCMRPHQTLFNNVWLFILAAISFTLPFLKNYVEFCVSVCLYGMFSGAFVAQISVMIVDILSPGNITISFGTLICFQGLGSAFGPPLCGAFKDLFGSFDEAFYFGGSLMSLAGTFMVCSNIFLKCKTRCHEMIPSSNG